MSIDGALNKFAAQGGLSVIFPYTDRVRGMLSPRLLGVYTADAALQALLKGTGFTYVFLDDSNVSIVPGHTDGPLSAAEAGAGTRGVPRFLISERPAQFAAADNARKTIAQVVIRGSKTLNTESPKDEDDVQPYVALPRETLRKSSSRDAFEELGKALTATTSGAPSQQQSVVVDADSSIDIRGFGGGQTLILLDGRRYPGSHMLGGTLQPDLRSIPLSMIERIEVLPNTGAAFYGAGATAGVINVVLRRDFLGTEASVQYESPFDHAVDARRAQFSHGSQTEDGTLRFHVFANYSFDGPLRSGDRPFLVRGRQAILQYYPEFYLDSPVVPLGSRVNVRSLAGPLFGPGTSSITYLPAGYVSGDGVAPLMLNAGSYNLELANSAQSVGGADANLLNGVERYSADAMLFHEIASSVTLFVNLAGARRRSRASTSAWQYGGVMNAVISAEAPNNPFGQPIIVSAPIHGGDGYFSSGMTSYRLIAGVIKAFDEGRTLTLDATRAWTSLALAGPESRNLADKIYDGSLDVMVDTSLYPPDVQPWWQDWRARPYRADTRDITMRFAGTVAPHWYAGAMTLNALVQHRAEEYGGGLEEMNSGMGTVFEPINTPGHQQVAVNSARAELTMPLVANTSPRGGSREAEVQLAVSRDSYKVDVLPASNEAGQTLDPFRFLTHFGALAWAAGVRYRFTDAMTLRISHGTGSLPPTMNQLTPFRDKQFTGTSGIVDARRGGEAIESVTFKVGGNPKLQPEDAVNTTAGFIFTPAFLKRCRLSIDGTYTRKTNNILNFGETAFSNLLKYEELCPECVVRETPAAGDPYGVGKIISVSAINMNGALLESLAVDGALELEMDLRRFGTLELSSRATWTRFLRMQLSPSSPVQEYAGLTTRYPLTFRGNLNLQWTKGRWAVEWDARYFDSYRVGEDSVTVLAQGAEKVQHQHLHNLHVTYRMRAWSRSDGETEIRVGVRDLLNSKPRFDAGQADGYYSTAGDPWLRSYSIAIHHHF